MQCLRGMAHGPTRPAISRVLGVAKADRRVGNWLYGGDASSSDTCCHAAMRRAALERPLHFFSYLIAFLSRTLQCMMIIIVKCFTFHIWHLALHFDF